MSRTNRSIIAKNVPLRLTPEEMENPQEIVLDFFNCFDLEDSRDILWLAFSAALCMDDEFLGEDLTRIEMLVYFEEIERLIEASFLIRQQERRALGK